MYLLAKPKQVTIYCLIAAALVAGLSGAQTAVAATGKVSLVPDRQPSLLVDKFELSQERPNSLFKGLPRSVVNAIRQDIAQRTGVNPAIVRILSYSRQTWSDACLGLPKSDELCAQVLTPGWRVKASANSQTWIYRTDQSGRNIRLEGDGDNSLLPKLVANAVLRDIETRFQVDRNRLDIISSERREWSDGCLGLAERGEVCTQAIVPGWQVTVTGNGQRWVYRTNATGSVVRYDRASNNIPDEGVELPKRVIDSVLKDAGSVLGVSADSLKITKAEERSWLGGCLELPEPGESCTKDIVSGWKVTVKSDKHQLIYHSDRSGSRLRLNKEASNFDKSKNSDLPQNAANAVLRETQRRSGLSRSRLKIVTVERQTWTDSCLGLGGPAEICATGKFPGWRVTVAGGNRRWVYRVDKSGRIIFESSGSNGENNGSITPIRIPANELPPPLKPNVVFRAISSGGFAGRTEETVLLEDGRVQRFTSNSSTPEQLNRLSSSEVREFKRLLDNERFSQFDRLEYPADGGADFFTVTFTSTSATTRYADLIQDRLPQTLQRVILAWNEVVNQ